MIVRVPAVALSLLLPISAQVVQIDGACPPFSSQVFASLSIPNPAIEGQPVLLQLGAFQSVGPVVLNVTVLGFQDPAAVLPSCGCTMHASLDWIDARLAPSPCACLPALSTVSVPLPVGSAGSVFYVQGFSLLAGSVAGGCTEVGADFLTSQSYRVTVQ